MFAVSSLFQTRSPTAHVATRREKVQVWTSGLSDGASNCLRIEIAQKLGTPQHAIRQAIQVFRLQLRGENEDSVA